MFVARVETLVYPSFLETSVVDSFGTRETDFRIRGRQRVVSRSIDNTAPLTSTKWGGEVKGVLASYREKRTL